MAVNIIGQSKIIVDSLNRARHIADTNFSVIILGETGSGKELFARYIHEQSARKKGEFIALNIAACNSNLIDSDLFGHEKGAFTGATSRRQGIFERAGGGTVLLDEIGDLSLDLQVKLLRVLENEEFQRVGGNDNLPMKARVLAATNVDLEQNVANGRFREDLCCRFATKLVVPSLRERKDDIPLLVKHIIDNEKHNLGKAYPDWFNEQYRQNLAQMLKDYPYEWPGNIRGLQQVLRALLIEVVHYTDPEKFEKQVSSVMESQCSSGKSSLEGELCRLISNLVRENIINYHLTNMSIRSRINGLLVEAISEGLDLALTLDNFVPRTQKELGEILGIPNLVFSSHPRLPKNDNDFMVKALKNCGYRDKFPKKVNDLIMM